jgi:hypothetical protein
MQAAGPTPCGLSINQGCRRCSRTRSRTTASASGVPLTRIEKMGTARDKRAAVRTVLEWYQAHYPAWFEWLEVV